MSSANQLPHAFFTSGRSSFADFLADVAPDVAARARTAAESAATTALASAPHGTTIVAVTYADGVVMAGDRRATVGNIIAQRDIEKVFATDAHSLIAIAGVAGPAALRAASRRLAGRSGRSPPPDGPGRESRRGTPDNGKQKRRKGIERLLGSGEDPQDQPHDKSHPAIPEDSDREDHEGDGKQLPTVSLPGDPCSCHEIGQDQGC